MTDGAILLRRADPFDLNAPSKTIWRIPRAIRDYCQIGCEWLQREIAKATCPVTGPNLHIWFFAIETLRNLPESDSPGLLENRLWFQTQCDFAVRGPCP